MTDASGDKLGEVLRTAREAKGVDLARVERETKIRVRYLAALEGGEYRELPGSVYTKGFLRNYGLYLGLDPDYLIDLYRIESASAVVERPAPPAPPRPIATRRSRAFVVTPGAVAAAILTVAVVAFVAWLGYEFLNFARQPTLRVLEPAGDLSSYAETSFVVSGVTEPGARVTVTGLTQNPSVTAAEDGSFEMEIRLVPGANQFTLVARDEVTRRESAEITRTITVVTEVAASPSPPPIAFELVEPGEGPASSPLTIAGRADPGSEVSVAATLAEAAPMGFVVTNGAGQPLDLDPEPPSAPEPITLDVGADGAFGGELRLPPGTWDLRVSLNVPEADAIARRVSIAPPRGLQGLLRIESAASYLEVEQDSAPLSGVSGSIGAPGDEHALSAEESLRVRAGNAAAVRITVNGIDLGVMGGSGAVVEWRISVEAG